MTTSIRVLVKSAPVKGSSGRSHGSGGWSSLGPLSGHSVCGSRPIHQPQVVACGSASGPGAILGGVNNASTGWRLDWDSGNEAPGLETAPKAN